MTSTKVPRITVIVCTRDRPQDLALCLPSLLANDYPDFSVLVMDQGETDAGEGVAAEHAGPRLEYHRLAFTGRARALNAALTHADGELLALTDDDCVAPRFWLRRAASVLSSEPEAGIVFGGVASAPHDPARVFVPTFQPTRYRVVRGRRVCAHGVGIGANLVVRREVVERIGGFDESLGPGSRFRSGDDWELAYRALRAGFAIVQDPANVIVHRGEREYATGAVRRLIGNNYHGIGAGYARHVLRGDWSAAYILVREGALLAGGAAWNTLRLRRPLGVHRLAYLLLGAVRGMRRPGDGRPPARSERWVLDEAK